MTELTVARFAALDQPIPSRQSVAPWPAFRAWLALPHDEQPGRGWAPIALEPAKRAKQNVQRVSALVLDYDDSGATLEAAARCWQGCEGVLHTTKSHTPGAPRFRAVLPLSRDATPAEYPVLWQRAQRRAAAAGHTIDKACCDGSRFWFCPPTGATFVDLAGVPIDVDGELERAAIEAEAAPDSGSRAREAGHSNGSADRPGDAFARRVDWAQLLQPFGWTKAGKQGEQDAWCRPGKKGAVSATCDGEHFYCFTSSAPPLEAQHSYDKLGLFAALNHHGDVGAAVKALAADGYGDRPPARRDEPGEPTIPIVLPWTWAADMAQPLPDPTWAVPALQFGPGRVNLIGGFGASLKTLLLQHILLAYVAKVSVLGQFPTAGANRGARHFDRDQGKRASMRRNKRLAFGMGIDLREIGQSLGLLSPPPFYLNTVGVRDVLMRELDGVGLAGFDCLRSFIPGSNEDSSESRVWLDLLTEVSEATQCTIIVLCHSPKESPDGKREARYRIRGTGGFYDAAGSVLDISGANGSPRLVTHTKTHPDACGAGVEPFYLDVRDVPDGGNPVAGVELVYLTSEQVSPPVAPEQVLREIGRKVLAVVQHNPGASLRRLRALVPGRATMVDAALETLQDDGTIRVDKGRSGGKAYFATTNTEDAEP